MAVNRPTQNSRQAAIDAATAPRQAVDRDRRRVQDLQWQQRSTRWQANMVAVPLGGELIKSQKKNFEKN